MASSTARASREDFKKQKELEELRKLAVAPPEVDEEGNMINPHIPQYMSVAPWYVSDGKVGLKHQKMSHFGISNSKSQLNTRPAPKFQKGKRAKKFRKGACGNCGAMTHKTRDCCERPRKRGARFTNKCAPDEIVHRTDDTDYDAKRDRYRNYDPAKYQEVIEFHQKVEDARRQKKAKEIDEQMKIKAQKKREKLIRKAEKRAAKKALKAAKGDDDDDDDLDSDSDSDSDSDDEDDEGNGENDLRDTTGEVIQKRDARTRTTVRNLRIREDTAKYLLNLNPKSAHYDPKTRSMRANPHPEKNPEELTYAGDNFVRESGDFQKVNSLQLFAMRKNETGDADVHLHAAPSQAELHYQAEQKRRMLAANNHRRSVLDKYGGTKHLKAPPKELLLAQSENYVEYSEDGRVVKGKEEAVAKSKYVEDQYDNNHTAVWGSYWSDGNWGYKCCCSTVRNSYCTGATGRAIEMSKKRKRIEA